MTVIRRKSASKLTEQREFFLSCAGKMEEIAKKELEDIAKEKKAQKSAQLILIKAGFTSALQFQTLSQQVYFLELLEECY